VCKSSKNPIVVSGGGNKVKIIICMGMIKRSPKQQFRRLCTVIPIRPSLASFQFFPYLRFVSTGSQGKVMGFPEIRKRNCKMISRTGSWATGPLIGNTGETPKAERYPDLRGSIFHELSGPRPGININSKFLAHPN
jgi:hypothetical protein